MKFIKKPIVINAILYNGSNQEEIKKFCKDNIYFKDTNIIIKSLEGDMIVNIGDYIIKGIKGEFYPCNPDIFKLTYDQI